MKRIADESRKRLFASIKSTTPIFTPRGASISLYVLIVPCRPTRKSYHILKLENKLQQNHLDKHNASNKYLYIRAV